MFLNEYISSNERSACNNCVQCNLAFALACFLWISLTKPEMLGWLGHAHKLEPSNPQHRISSDGADSMPARSPLQDPPSSCLSPGDGTHFVKIRGFSSCQRTSQDAQ